jgi:hypothetical protein
MSKYYKILLLIIFINPINLLAEHPENTDDWLPMDELNFCQYIHTNISLEERYIRMARERNKEAYGYQYDNNRNIIKDSFESLSNLITSYNYFCGD